MSERTRIYIEIDLPLSQGERAFIAGLQSYLTRWGAIVHRWGPRVQRRGRARTRKVES